MYALLLFLEFMESTMTSTTSQSTPPEQVEALIQRVADEAGLEVGGLLNAAGRVEQAPAKAPQTVEVDDLEARLAALRK